MRVKITLACTECKQRKKQIINNTVVVAVVVVVAAVLIMVLDAVFGFGLNQLLKGV